MPQGGQPVLEVQGVSKTFPGAKVLDEVAFTVGSKRIHALLGHNGSGKSTLIKILAGVYTPDSGSSGLVGGEPLSFGAPRDSHRRGLRFVHQDLGLIAELSALENMALTWGYPRRRNGMIRWGEHRRRVDAALARLGVEVDVNAPISQIRPVSRTAVAIARALGDAEGSIGLLVLDEPTAALPPAEVGALFSILRDVRDQGVSIIYVSHRLEEVLELADDASVLRDGVLQQSLPLDGVARSDLVDLIVGSDEAGDDEVPPVSRAAVARRSRVGRPVFDIVVSAEQLREVHLELRRGEILGVAGLSGSGREDLCAAVVGATWGQCAITDLDDGAALHRVTPAAARDLGIALVLPNRSAASAVAPFSMRENVTLPGLGRHTRLGFVRKGSERALLSQWIDRLDIRPHDPEHLYALLSGGNQQKTVLAKWLAMNPRALLLDDPTTGVDVGARARIYELIAAQAAEGLAVLVASSDLEDLAALCDRVVVLARGQVAQELAGEQLQVGVMLDALNEVSVVASIGGSGK